MSASSNLLIVVAVTSKLRSWSGNLATNGRGQGARLDITEDGVIVECTVGVGSAVISQVALAVTTTGLRSRPDKAAMLVGVTANDEFVLIHTCDT